MSTRATKYQKYLNAGLLVAQYLNDPVFISPFEYHMSNKLNFLLHKEKDMFKIVELNEQLHYSNGFQKLDHMTSGLF